MPFADEAVTPRIVPYDERWPSEFDLLAERLREVELEGVEGLDHVGSTSVPGLWAKDVLDVQVRLRRLDPPSVRDALCATGLRWRPEEWNNLEALRSGATAPKLVFAPAAGARACNVHVRAGTSEGARDTLLFRDYLRANGDAREAWSACKRAFTELVAGIDLATYGQLKQPAWRLLMLGADRWATSTGWRMPAPLCA